MAATRETTRGDDTDLIRELYPKLRRFAAVVAPSEVDPDDLVQESLVNTIRLRPLASLQHPSSYLWKAMNHLATDHRRRLGRQRKAMERVESSGVTDPTYPSDLDVLLERLTPRARAVLYLHEIDGYTYSEIGAMLKAKEATVRMTASRARRSLRGALSKEESDAAS